MIEFFVKRPVTTIMFICVFVVLGIASYSNLQIEKTPRIDLPIITVSAVYPGATPLEVETLVINKIEDAVAEISEIQKIRSQSYESFGYIYIEFLISADVNIKSIEVKDKVEAILNDLPEAMERPLIEKYDPLMEPVMDLVLSSDTLDSRDIYEYADKTLKTKLSAVEGIAKVDVYGGKERQINVRLDPILMKKRYITINEVIMALKMKNKNIPAGVLDKGENSLSLRFVGEFQDINEIANMKLISSDGVTFVLKDIAVVQDSFKKVDSIVRYNGKEVVSLSLKKVSDGNAVGVAKEVRARLNEFREFLPEGMKLDIATDTTNYIVNETFDTLINILIGLILTVVILYLFTGHANLTFIAAIVIPASLISTFAPMSASGFSINFLTLLAIATALGTLIANAIVIIENVLAHLEHKETAVHAAIDGTKEVAGAILASTGTNLVVFTPIAMMGGTVGMFMRSFGLTVVYATIFSLISSFTLTPMLCGLLLKKKIKKQEEQKVNIFLKPFRWLVLITNKIVEFFKKEYKYVFEAMFSYPKSTIFFVALLFFSLKFIMPYIASDFMPHSDEDKIKIAVTMPQGSTIDRTSKVVKSIENRIKKIPETVSYFVNIGKNGVENAEITLDLKSSKKRNRSDADIIDELIPFMAKIPDAEIELIRSGGMGGGMMEGDVSVNLYGLDYDKMIEFSQEAKKIMIETGYFRSVKSSYKAPKTEIQFIPDQEKLIEYGLTSAQVGSIVRASIYGDDSNVYKEKGEEYDINVELDNRYAETFDDVKEITVLSRKGLIPITELGDINEEKSVPVIWHRDKDRVIRLEGYLSKGSLVFVKGLLAKEFKKINFSQGYGYNYVGNSERQEEAAQETSKAFILAVILTYMLLCAILNSFKYPISILLTVVTSFIGVFYTLFFLEQSINIASMLGIVMLVGLVVNNSILLIDYTLLKMSEGVPVKEALWIGASEKFRAIIMTSAAIILGVLPQLGSIMEGKKSMAAVMIGGMVASVVFTFIFVPIVFWYIEKLNIKVFVHKGMRK